MISVDGLQGLLDRLASLDISAAQTRALESAAQALEAKTKQAITGNARDDHWKQSSQSEALCESMTHTVEAERAVIGSCSAIAVGQELGTSYTPPCGFMIAVAQSGAEDIVRIAANALAEGLGGGND